MVLLLFLFFSFSSLFCTDCIDAHIRDNFFIPMRDEVEKLDKISCFISKVDGDPLAEKQDLFISFFEMLGVTVLKDNPDLNLGESIQSFMNKIIEKNNGKYLVDHVIVLCTETLGARVTNELSGIAKEVRLIETRINNRCKPETFLTCVLFSGHTFNAIPNALSGYLHTAPAIVDEKGFNVYIAYYVFANICVFKFFPNNEVIKRLCTQLFNYIKINLPVYTCFGKNPFDLIEKTLTKFQIIYSRAVSQGNPHDIELLRNPDTFENGEDLYSAASIFIHGFPPYIHQDARKAFDFFKIAASCPHFHPESICHLAGYYAKGMFVEIDLSHAKELLDQVFVRENLNLTVFPYLMKAYKLIGDEEKHKATFARYIDAANKFKQADPLWSS
jgi:hypothetical protein